MLKAQYPISRLEKLIAKFQEEKSVTEKLKFFNNLKDHYFLQCQRQSILNAIDTKPIEECVELAKTEFKRFKQDQSEAAQYAWRKRKQNVYGIEDGKIELCELVLNPKSKPRDIYTHLLDLILNGVTCMSCDSYYYKKNTPLHLAILEKRLNLIEPLVKWSNYLSSMFSLNSEGNSCLNVALLTLENHDATQTIRSLFDSKFSAGQFKNLVENRSVKYALEKKNLEAFKLIVSHPLFNEYYKYDKFEQLPLHQAIQFQDSAAFAFALELTKYVNQLDKKDMSPLMLAVKANNFEFVKMLLDHPQIAVNHQNKEGQTALHLAFAQSKTNEAIIQLLIAKGADSQIVDIYEMSPLHLGIISGYPDRLIKTAGMSHADPSLEHDVGIEILKPFKERAGLITSTLVDAKLFGHINNDHRIAGTAYERNSLTNTLAYAIDILRLLAYKKINSPIEEKASIPEQLLNQLMGLKKQSENFDRTAQKIHVDLLQMYSDKAIKAYVKTVLDELANSIEESFNHTESVLIPGGWNGRNIGQSMIYEFSHENFKSESETHFVFSIYTAEATGLEPDNQLTIAKHKSDAVIQFKIPLAIKSEFFKLIRELIDFYFNDFWSDHGYLAPNDNKIKIDTTLLYKTIITFVLKYQISVIENTESRHFITRARAKTTAWKVVNSLCKVKLPPTLFSVFKFESKLQSMIEFFVLEHEKNTLFEIETKREYLAAIENLARWINKQCKKNPAEIKQYAQHIDTLENLTTYLKQKKISVVLENKIENLIRYQQPHPGFGQVQFPSESIKFTSTNKTPEEILYQYTTQFHISSPLADLRALDKLLASFKPDHEGDLFVRKAVEKFCLALPLEEKAAAAYWGSLKDHAESYETMGLIVSMQRNYNNRIKESKVALPVQIITTLTLLSIQLILTERYFSSNDNKIFYTLLWLIGDFKKCFFTSPLFYIPQGQLDSRFTEIKSILLDIHEKVPKVPYQYLHLVHFDFDDILESNQVSADQLTSMLDFDCFKNYRTDTGKLPKMSYKAKMQILLYAVLYNFPEKLPQEVVNQCNFLSLFRLGTIEGHWYLERTATQTNLIIDNNMVKRYACPRIGISKDEDELKCSYTFGFGGWLQLEVKKFLPALHLSDYNYTYQTLLDRFQFSKLTKLGTNEIQVHDSWAKLTKAKAAIQQVLHTRINPKTTITTTLNLLLTEIPQLINLDYQALLKINLFNPGVFQTQVSSNPAIIKPILKLLEQGLVFFIEENNISYPVHFLFELGFLVQSYLLEMIKKQKTAPLITLLKDLEIFSSKLKTLIALQDTKIKQPLTDAEKIKVNNLQAKFYFNLLQEMELAIESGVSLNQDMILQFLHIQFNIQKLLVSLENGVQAIDPILLDVQESVEYLIFPALANYFKSLSSEKLTKLLKKILPESYQSLADEKLTLVFPCLLAGSDDNTVTINLLKGSIRKSNFILKKTPTEVLNSKYCSQFFGKDLPSYMLVNENNTEMEFIYKEELYHLEIIGGYSKSEKIHKQITLNNQKRWFYLLPNAENIPKIYADQSHLIWASLPEKESKPVALIADATSGKYKYIMEAGQIFTLPEDKNSYQLIAIASPHCFAKSTPFDFLSRFENWSYIEILKRSTLSALQKTSAVPSSMDNISDDDLIIKFPRYGLTFTLKNVRDHFFLVFNEDARYALDLDHQHDLIPGFNSFLTLHAIEDKLDPVILIPRLPFITTAKHVLDLDKTSIAMLDSCLIGDTLRWDDLRPWAPGNWQLANTQDYFKIPLSKNGMLCPQSSEDALYLCYLFTVTKNPEMAKTAFDQFKSLGGILGNRTEAEILYWFFRAIPYQIQSEKSYFNSNPTYRSEKHPASCSQTLRMHSDSIIHYPELTALRAQLLVLVLEFLSSQKRFALFSKKGNQNPHWDEKLQNILKKYFTIDNIKKKSQEILREYSQTKNNIPKNLRLSWKDLLFLKTYITHERMDEKSLTENRHLQLSPKKVQTALSDLTIVVLNLDDCFLIAPSEYAMEYWPRSIKEYWVYQFSSNNYKHDQIEELIYTTPFVPSFQSYYSFLIRNQRVSIDEYARIQDFRKKIWLHITSVINLNYFKLIDSSYIESEREKDLFVLEIALLYIIDNPEHFKSIPFYAESIEKEDPKNNIKDIFRMVNELARKNPITIPILGFKQIEEKKLDEKLQKTRTDFSDLQKQFKTFLARGITDTIPTVKNLLEKLELSLAPSLLLSSQTTIQEEKLSAIRTALESKSELEAEYQIGLKLNEHRRLFQENAAQVFADTAVIKTLKSAILTVINFHSKDLEKAETELLQIFNASPEDKSLALQARGEQLGLQRFSLGLKEILENFISGEWITLLSKHSKNKLADDYLQSIFYQITKYLINRSTLDHYQRILNYITKSNIETLNTKSETYKKGILVLSEMLVAERAIDVNHPRFLASLMFEYKKNTFLRPAQQQILDLLIKPIVFQLLMGEGKTKFIIPSWALQKASGFNLVIIIAPAGLLETYRRDLGFTSQGLNQKAWRFHFDRYTDCSITNLKLILNYFLRCIYKRNYLVCSNTVFPSIELKWLETLAEKKSNEEQISLFETLLDLVQENGDAFFDEIGSTANIFRELNYAMEDEIGLRKSTLQDSLFLYTLFKYISFKINDRTLILEEVFNRSFPELSKSAWKELFDKELAEKLIDCLLISSKLSIKIILSKLENASVPEAELKSYLLSKEACHPKFLELLEIEEKHELALYKEQVNYLLPATLYKKPNTNYGKPILRKKIITTKEDLAVPFDANGIESPRSHFASCYQIVNCTIQINKFFGISVKVLKQFIEDFQVMASEERNLSDGKINLDDTDNGKLFNEITGLTLSRLTPINVITKKEMRSLYKALAKKQQVIDYCLEHYILPKIKLNPRILRHDAKKHEKMYRSRQGCAGTFISAAAFNALTSKGVVGRMIDTLKSRKKDGTSKTFIVKADLHDPLLQIKKLLTSNPNYRAIIDVGAYFYGISNLKIARMLAQFYAEKPELKIKYILFYNAKHVLCLLKVGSDKVISIGSSDLDFIKKKIKAEFLDESDPSEWFTYYDELRKEGTDISQMDSAHAIITIGSQTLLHDFLQGAMRMRDLANTHDLTVLLPRSLHEASKKEWNIHTIVDMLYDTQREAAFQYNFQTSLLDIRSVIYRDFILRLRKEKNFQRKKEYNNEMKPFWFSEIQDEPYVTFGKKNVLVLTEKALRERAATDLEFWKKTLKNLNITLEKPVSDEIESQLNTIILKAQQLCKEYVLMHNELYDREVTTASHTQTNTTQQQQSHLQLEINLTEQVLHLHPECKAAADFIPWPTTFNFQNITISHNNSDPAMPKMFLLNDLLKPKKPADPIPPKFADEILVSENYLKSTRAQENYLIDLYIKPVHYLLFAQENKLNTLRVLIITQDEAVYLSTLRDESKMENTDKSIWITTPQQLEFFGNKPDRCHPSYDVLMEQIWFFNGDILPLIRNIERLSWIKQDVTAKLSFFEFVIRALRPDKSVTYPFFKKCFLQRNSTKFKLFDSKDASSVSESKAVLTEPRPPSKNIPQ